MNLDISNITAIKEYQFKVFNFLMRFFQNMLLIKCFIKLRIIKPPIHNLI